MEKSTLCLILICLWFQPGRCDDDDDKEFPDLEKLTRNGFVAQIEITNRPSDETIFVTEYYYGGQDQTRVDIVRDGKEENVYFYPSNDVDQIAIVKNDACVVDTAGTSDYLLDFNFTNWLYSADDDKKLFFGPSSVLRSAASSPPTYVGKETIRGIPCHKFSGTFEADSDVEADYFFTDENWITPANVSKGMIPVRVRLYGKGKVMEDTPEQMFEQTMDYVFFRTSVDKIRLLQPPSGLGCRGLKNQGAELPSPSLKFSVTGEFRNLTADDESDKTLVVPFRLWYHYEKKLARLDLRTGVSRSTSTVYDFNTGLQYVTSNGKMCEAEPIRHTTFEKFDDGLVGVMKKPESIFGTDGKSYYLGKTFVRGMYCDVWESVQEDASKAGSVVYTFYFTSHYWEVAVDGKVEEKLPVKVDVNIYNGKGGRVKLMYSMFAFDNIPTFRFGPFNILDCAGVPSGKNYFLITFTGSEDSVRKAEDRAAIVRNELEIMIPDAAQVSSLRLPFLRVDFESGLISVLGLLLESVPAIKRFEKVEAEDKPRDKEQEVKNLASDEDCARVCTETDGCTAFHWCGKRCFVSTLDLNEKWGNEYEGVTDCSLYLRVEGGSTEKDVSLDKALDNLEEAVRKKTFSIVLEETEDGNEDEKLLKPDEFLRDLSPFGVGDRDRNMHEKLVSGKSFKKPEDSQIIVDGGFVSSPSDCYRKCRDEKSMLCFSFSFCFSDRRCLLSPLYVSAEHPSKIDDQTLTVGGCDIYTVSYSEMFVRYPGTVSLMPGKKEKSKVQSDNECAKLCRDEEEFVCRGFEYCMTEKICQLHEKHVLDAKGDMTRTGKSCSHYALKYAADYTELGRVKLVDPQAQTLEVSNLEECAKSCSEKSEFQCASFDLCSIANSDRKSCVLSQRTLEQEDTKTEDSSSCKHYTKNDVVDDWAKPRTAQKPPPTGYTPRGLAGVIFGTLFLGLLIGVIAFLGYSFFRSRSSGEGISVKFVKQENA